MKTRASIFWLWRELRLSISGGKLTDISYGSSHVSSMIHNIPLSVMYEAQFAIFEQAITRIQNQAFSFAPN